MANTSIDLVGLEFDQIKSNLKSYLKRSDSPFKDVDFEGSNISNFLDVLAYNTYLNNFYLNMVASEMFLDTAQLRDSVVSHAKELNYTPRSYRSAQADISFNITPASSNTTTLIIPKGTSFSTRVGSNNFTFSTDEVQVVNANTDGVFYISTTVYEGSYFSDTFVYTPSNTSQRFVISNPTVDTRSITVLVYENSGANVYTYTQASSFLGQQSNSQIYFLQAAENDQYEIIFGDDVIGRKPKAGAAIYVEYRVGNGELPNGARLFDIDGPISGQANISTITTTSSATGGAVSESITSIKYNATKHYQNQERAVTVDDFEALLERNFPEINAVSAYGGEDADPPVYGKVFIAVDIESGIASISAKNKYYNFIKPRTSVSIDPIFVDPEYLYCEIYSTVRYNVNVTTLKDSDIKSLTAAVISNYNTAYLNGFKKTLRTSKLSEAINNSQASIVSNDLHVSPFKTIMPISGVTYKNTLEFGFTLDKYYTVSYDDIVRTQIPAVRTTSMAKDGKECYVKDDGNGILGLYTVDGVATETLLSTVGTVDYNSGKIIFTNLNIDSYVPASGNHVHVYANPYEKDISSIKNQIITIRDSDMEIVVQAVKL